MGNEVGMIEMGGETSGKAPFALYNIFRANRWGPSEPLINDGYEGSKFDVGDQFNTGLPLDSDWEQDPAPYRDSSAFGGNLGPGPITCIIAPNNFRYLGTIEVQWQFFSAAFTGVALNTQWSTDGGYALMELSYRAEPAADRQATGAYWDFDISALTGGQLISLTLYPGTTDHVWTMYEDNSLTLSPSPAHYNVNGAGPNTFNSYPAPADSSRTNVWMYSTTSAVLSQSPLVHYMAWVNGTVDLADWTFEKWNAFSETGARYPPQLSP